MDECHVRLNVCVMHESRYVKAGDIIDLKLVLGVALQLLYKK